MKELSSVEISPLIMENLKMVTQDGNKYDIREIKVEKAFKVYPDFNLEEDFKYPYHLTPYQGCTFGCVYCFNTKNKEYWTALDSNHDKNQIAVAVNLADLLKKELPFYSKSHDLPLFVRIGTEAEIYGPAEKDYQITRSILTEFINYPGWKGEIPTKSELVLRDIDLLRQLDFHVTMTIITTDEHLASKLEPYAPSIQARIAVLRELRANGIKCRIRCEPYLDGITDLDNLFKIKEELGLEKVKIKKLNYYSLDEIKKLAGIL